MKLFTGAVALFTWLNLAAAIPATSPVNELAALAERAPFQYNTVTFTFNAAAATYTFSIPLDGQNYQTNVSTLNVDHIRSGSYEALTFCTFYGPGGKVLYQPPLKRESPGVIAVGPPQPIASVQCAPSSNQCFPNYYTCSYSSPTTGTFISNCCSGYCAASKCRPTS